MGALHLPHPMQHASDASGKCITRRLLPPTRPTARLRHPFRGTHAAPPQAGDGRRSALAWITAGEGATVHALFTHAASRGRLHGPPTRETGFSHTLPPPQVREAAGVENEAP